MTKTKGMTEKELLELGKKLEEFYKHGYVNKKQALLFSVYKGIATGFGAVLGGTIVVGVLIWILSLFDQVPVLDHFIQNINHTLQNK